MSDVYKKVLIWTVLTIAVLATITLVILGVMQPASSTNQDFAATTAPAITSTDHVEGSSNAKVSVIEYGDFQCPACGDFYPIVKQMITNYDSKIKFAFRNFPLPQHPDAQIAAQAAEAAGLQGEYWQMNNLLYEKQNEWTIASPSIVVSQFFDSYASSLGLNVNKFNVDINSTEVLNKIKDDVAGANSAAVNHTPTFFINLKQIPNPDSYGQFKSTIDQALSAAGA
ncbi:MAG: DsbA family protein [Patescibacteria group bacterium]|nr:DsbA family protein [Patescibacteria group bacterium]MCL5224317.1 DsbA family protein [Patescibacteria group bacterium]